MDHSLRERQERYHEINQYNRRRRYTLEEDEKILQYVEKNAGSWQKESGNKIWIAMEHEKVTEHPWQSMRTHFLKFIIPKINRTDHDRYCKIVRFASELGIEVPKKRGRPRSVIIEDPVEDYDPIEEDPIQDFASPAKQTTTKTMANSEPSRSDNNNSNHDHNNNNNNNYANDNQADDREINKSNTNTGDSDNDSIDSDIWKEDKQPASAAPKHVAKTYKRPPKPANSSKTTPSSSKTTPNSSKTTPSSSKTTPNSTKITPNKTTTKSPNSGKSFTKSPTRSTTPKKGPTLKKNSPSSPTFNQPSRSPSPRSPSPQSSARNIIPNLKSYPASGSPPVSPNPKNFGSGSDSDSDSSGSSTSSSTSKHPKPKLAAKPKPKLATPKPKKAAQPTASPSPSYSPSHTSPTARTSQPFSPDTTPPPSSQHDAKMNHSAEDPRRSKQIRKEVREIQLQFDLSAPVIFHALITSGGSVPTAKRFLEYSKEDAYMPWTRDEDKVLTGDDLAAISSLKRKRGAAECIKRCEFLEPKIK